jgi:hypothetical protein
MRSRATFSGRAWHGLPDIAPRSSGKGSQTAILRGCQTAILRGCQTAILRGCQTAILRLGFRANDPHAERDQLAQDQVR